MVNLSSPEALRTERLRNITRDSLVLTGMLAATAFGLLKLDQYAEEFNQPENYQHNQQPSSTD